MIFAVVFWVLASISIIYICYNRQKIKYAITILRCSVDYTVDYPKIFVLPLLISIGYILFLTFWLFTAMTIYSSGEELTEYKTPYGYLKSDESIQGLIFLHIVCYFWVSEYFVSYT